MSDLEKAGVVGAGLMGSEIAVLLRDVRQPSGVEGCFLRTGRTRDSSAKDRFWIGP